jgi:hypothetical protein
MRSRKDRPASNGVDPGETVGVIFNCDRGAPAPNRAPGLIARGYFFRTYFFPSKA